MLFLTEWPGTRSEQEPDVASRTVENYEKDSPQRPTTSQAGAE